MSYRSNVEKLRRGWEAWKRHFLDWWGPYIAIGGVVFWFGIITLIWLVTEGH